MGKDLIDLIAEIIGYHFWKPKSEGDAIRHGKDCAKEIRAMLEREAPIIDEYIEIRQRKDERI